ncbi:MAG: AI-2E family transporter [Armatimonadota bacterium]
MSDVNGPATTASSKSAPEPASEKRKLSGAWWKLALAVFVAGLCVLTACYLIYDLRRVLLIFGLGYLVAYLCEPVIGRLQRAGWSRLWAVWTTILGLVVIVSLIVGALVPVLVSQAQDVAQNWPTYTERADEVYRTWRVAVEQWLGQRFPQTNITQFIDIWISNLREWLASSIPAILQWVSATLLASLGAVGVGLITLVISFHFMMLRETMKKTLRRLIPSDQHDEMSEVSTEIAAMLGAYVRSIAVTSVLMGICVWAVLAGVGVVFGSKYALTIGAMAAVVHLIPYVGVVLTVGGSVFLTYVTASHAPFWAALIAGLLIALIDQAFDFIVRPQIIGRRIHLHPLIVLFAIFVGYEMLGFIGMVIAIPIAASIKIALAKWVPVIGPAPGVHAPSEPLALDIAQTVRIAWRWGQRTIARELGADTGAESGQKPADKDTSSDASTDNRDDRDE